MRERMSLRVMRVGVFTVSALCCSYTLLAQEDHHTHPSQEQRHTMPQQTVEVRDFPAHGLILAVGGGGEGVIGRLKGEQVVAIDVSRRELDEAPPGPLKLVMDARDMTFVDESFATVTSFFTLMYIAGADHPRVFAEVHRVLRPGGRFLIWDATFGERPDPATTAGVVPLTVKLPDQTVNTGYGVHWPDEVHDLAYYTRLAERAGFDVVASKDQDQWLYLEAKKK